MPVSAVKVVLDSFFKVPRICQEEIESTVGAHLNWFFMQYLFYHNSHTEKTQQICRLINEKVDASMQHKTLRQRDTRTFLFTLPHPEVRFYFEQWLRMRGYVL